MEQGLKTYSTYFMEITTVNDFRNMCRKQGYNISNKLNLVIQEFLKKEEGKTT